MKNLGSASVISTIYAKKSINYELYEEEMRQFNKRLIRGLYFIAIFLSTDPIIDESKLKEAN